MHRSAPAKPARSSAAIGREESGTRRRAGFEDCAIACRRFDGGDRCNLDDLPRGRRRQGRWICSNGSSRHDDAGEAWMSRHGALVVRISLARALDAGRLFGCCRPISGYFTEMVVVDGFTVGTRQEVVLRDRMSLSQDGMFVIIASVNPDFSDRDNSISTCDVWVSSLAIVLRRHGCEHGNRARRVAFHERRARRDTLRFVQQRRVVRSVGPRPSREGIADPVE